ncbi:MAG: hypothetical protein ACFCVA_03975 [Gammaproteobacteria bacterium]
MADNHRIGASNPSAVDNIDRWKRAMDGIATTFVETGINPAEGMFIMAKCIGHALQEVPDPGERERLLGNLMSIVRRIMQHKEDPNRDTFVWN